MQEPAQRENVKGLELVVAPPLFFSSPNTHLCTPRYSVGQCTLVRTLVLQPLVCPAAITPQAHALQVLHKPFGRPYRCNQKPLRVPAQPMPIDILLLGHVASLNKQTIIVINTNRMPLAILQLLCRNTVSPLSAPKARRQILVIDRRGIVIKAVAEVNTKKASRCPSVHNTTRNTVATK